MSGIRSLYRTMVREARSVRREGSRTRLSQFYNKWQLDYRVMPLPELDLPRSSLHRLLALRTTHGDYALYHKRFRHEGAELRCGCGSPKTPEHLVFCHKTFNFHRKRPLKAPVLPFDRREGSPYLNELLATTKAFAGFLTITGFYTSICT